MDMDKRLLNQSLKFRENTPTFSQTKYLNSAVKAYEQEHEKVFTHIRFGQKSKVLDWDEFFLFLSEVGNSGRTISTFEDIEYLLAPAVTRQESIENTGDSKSRYISVFDGVVIFQHLNEQPRLYRYPDEISVDDTPIVAVENGETFLRIYDIMSRFGYGQYIYLGGMANSATREFLKGKNVTFFLDYDIEAIRIYDSFECGNKSFFRHPELESYFANVKYQNEVLYRKQLSVLPGKHDELQWLIDLINLHSAVMEQEIF